MAGMGCRWPKGGYGWLELAGEAQLLLCLAAVKVEATRVLAEVAVLRRGGGRYSWWRCPTKMTVGKPTTRRGLLAR